MAGFKHLTAAVFAAGLAITGFVASAQAHHHHRYYGYDRYGYNGPYFWGGYRYRPVYPAYRFYYPEVDYYVLPSYPPYYAVEPPYYYYYRTHWFYPRW
jgi:hypothetical protein